MLHAAASLKFGTRDANSPRRPRNNIKEDAGRRCQWHLTACCTSSPANPYSRNWVWKIQYIIKAICHFTSPAVCPHTDHSGLFVLPLRNFSASHVSTFKSACARSFQYRAPLVLNSLPLKIRHSWSLSSFNSQLKTHLFLAGFAWNFVIFSSNLTVFTDWTMLDMFVERVKDISISQCIVRCVWFFFF